MTPKIGIFTPLHGRPDFARMVAMQFAFQTVLPTHVAFYQNGPFENYQWAINDLKLPYRYDWIYNGTTDKHQENWYGIPLKMLLSYDCDYYFWCDQDDIYQSDHISNSIADLILNDADIVLNSLGGLLKVNSKNFTYEVTRFKAHDPDGISSSMAFNKRFAKELYIDLYKNLDTVAHFWADNVVSRETMPKFKVYRNPTRHTVTYLCHNGTTSSAHWLEDLPPVKTN